MSDGTGTGMGDGRREGERCARGAEGGVSGSTSGEQVATAMNLSSLSLPALAELCADGHADRIRSTHRPRAPVRVASRRAVHVTFSCAHGPSDLGPTANFRILSRSSEALYKPLLSLSWFPQNILS